VDRKIIFLGYEMSSVSPTMYKMRPVRTSVIGVMLKMQKNLQAMKQRL